MIDNSKFCYICSSKLQKSRYGGLNCQADPSNKKNYVWHRYDYVPENELYIDESFESRYIIWFKKKTVKIIEILIKRTDDKYLNLPYFEPDMLNLKASIDRVKKLMMLT